MTTLLSKDVLKLDAAREAERLVSTIRRQIFGELRRKGAVLGLSGGIDSSLTAALCARALGAEKVAGLLLPEADSSPDSLRLGRMLADSLGIKTILEDITPILEAAGCYRRRDEAIRSLIPDYTHEYRSKIVVTPPDESCPYTFFSVVVESPSRETKSVRLTLEAYRGIIAATNFKQRVRSMMGYYHADRLSYAYIGTPNLLEYDQGFFVKNGDGAADLKPIAHLYKTQVYQLAEYFNIPGEIQRRPPSTDTYSMEQSQEEFYSSIPLHEMDLCLWGKNHGWPTEKIAVAVGRSQEQVERVLKGIDSKRAATRYLHAPPLLCREPVRDQPSTNSETAGLFEQLRG
jgi:NAD+ synthase